MRGAPWGLGLERSASGAGPPARGGPSQDLPEWQDSRPALTLSSASLWDWVTWRSGVTGAGSRAGAAQQPRLTVPFRPNPPQVAEGGPAREPLQLLEVSPRKRLTAGPEQDPCGSRPAPEGAGAGAEQGHSAGGGGWCRHCHTKLAELKRQAWKLVSGPGTPLRVSDPSSGRPRTGPVPKLGRPREPEGDEIPLLIWGQSCPLSGPWFPRL